MAQFNLAEYETVAERLIRFHAAHPDGRIITEEISKENDRAKGIWVVKTSIYLTGEDLVADLPKATGYAFEVDGGSGANRTAALENAETSSIGRCLANMNFASGQNRASREEMEKAARGVATPRSVESVEAPEDFDKTLLSAYDLDALQGVWEAAVKAGYSDKVKAAVQRRKKEIQDGNP
jgi:hypothetical protein